MFYKLFVCYTSFILDTKFYNKNNRLKDDTISKTLKKLKTNAFEKYISTLFFISQTYS